MNITTSAGRDSQNIRNNDGRGQKEYFVTDRRKLKFYQYILIFFVYLVAAVIFTYPLIKQISNRFSPNLGDPLFISWLISWNQHWLLSANHSLSALFNANIYYPYLKTLAFSDLMLIPSIVGLPLRLFTANPIIISNIILIAFMAFTGLAMFLLARYLTGSGPAALFIGLFYAFSPYHLAQIGHIQLQTDVFLILMLLYLHKYLDNKNRLNLVTAGLFVALEALTAWYYAIYAAILLALFIIYFTFFGLIKINKKFLISLAITLFFMALIIVPFALPYLYLHNNLPEFVRNIGETRAFSARPLNYLMTVKQNWLWGRLLGLGVSKIETVLFPGLAVVLLAGASLFGLKANLIKRQRTAQIKFFYFLVAALGFIMSLGPYRRVFGRIVPFPFGAAFLTIPGFKVMRVPARFGIFVLLGLSILAAYGLKLLFKLWSEQRLFSAKADLALILGLIFMVVQQISGPALISKPISSGANIPSIYKWLAAQKEYNIIIEAPLLPGEDVKYVYFSSYHRKKLYNGYSGYTPPTWSRLKGDLRNFPDRRSLKAISRTKADGIVVHSAILPGWNQDKFDLVKKKFKLVKTVGGDYFFVVKEAKPNTTKH